MNHEKADAIARSYYIAMVEGQDWLSLPPDFPIDGDELQKLARQMAGTVTRSSLILTLANGQGTSTERLRALLARVYAAGVKTGSAMTTANVSRGTSKED